MALASPSISKTALQRRIKQQIGARTHAFYVVVPPGFETAAKAELSELGIHAALAGRGGLSFSGEWPDCWRVHHQARIPGRVLVRVTRFTARSFIDLEKQIKKIPWELWLDPRKATEFSVVSSHSILYHESAIQERVAQWLPQLLKPWVVCYQGVEQALYDGQQALYFRFENNQCTVSLDCSGELLYKRGYDKHVNKAPLRDNLAAAMLRVAGWPLCETLLDPMAGSGTFGLEALLSRCQIGAGHLRHFAFEGFPAHRSKAWQQFLKNSPIHKPKPARVEFSDSDVRSFDIVKHNLEALKAHGVDLNGVEHKKTDFFALKPPSDPAQTLLMLNPPYGARLQSGAVVRGLYRKIGQKLRTDFTGCRFGILVPNKTCEHELRLTRASKYVLDHGGIPVSFLTGKL